MHGGAGCGKIPCRIGPLKLGRHRRINRKADHWRARRADGGSCWFSVAAAPSDAEQPFGSAKLNGSVGRVGNRPVNRLRHRNRLIGWSDIIGGGVYKVAARMNRSKNGEAS